ncbi:hypothetical protein HG536_0G01200 [Torulaspora globosa]|uniref:Copper-fist domain-containing protein n=1 Tax=Torulaspora globosa TaxID=48254 RepID=A0A7G3ZL75_9SACH|nr:uncharacterized protein HG536_0G01200 [Torulaspora globosa]QLL34261.1 hypothetical protein HG536_0G01200 [Torulaspora globosa]
MDVVIRIKQSSTSEARCRLSSRSKRRLGWCWDARWVEAGEVPMIIYDGEKYACVSCIRGHRSSTCRHTSRMLVKVRSRGRHASLDIRKVIIVDTESQVTPDDNQQGGDSSESCDGAKECDKMNKQPILFLRTIRMQKAVLIDGKLKIIVEENGSGNDDEGKPSYKYVSEKEFLRQCSINLSSAGEGCRCSCKESQANGIKTENKQEVNKALRAGHPAELPAQSPDAAQNVSQTAVSDLSSQSFFKAKPMFELLTHRGLYLSTQCSCKEGNCPCATCLLHRNEDELNSYIQRSGVPLTNMGEAPVAHQTSVSCPNSCNCSAEECQCQDCLEHPTEIISFNRFVFFGILNVNLKRKTIINYKGRLIPSQFWWDFLKHQVPLMSENQLDNLEINSWFDKIVTTYDSQLIDTRNLHFDFANPMFGA